MSKLIENDVRLMRRSLIALQFKESQAAWDITTFLRDVREINMILPDEQTEKERDRFLVRLLDKEKYLARKFGCILLPDCYDCIFLNSKWANPYTLYVRLVSAIPELGQLGEIYWMPDSADIDWKELAEKNHAEYLKAITVPDKPKTWWQKLLGR